VANLSWRKKTEPPTFRLGKTIVKRWQKCFAKKKNKIPGKYQITNKSPGIYLVNEKKISPPKKLPQGQSNSTNFILVVKLLLSITYYEFFLEN
jgi:hypothetical protein